MNKITVESCKEFINSIFDKLPFKNGGIEANLFWRKAENAGFCCSETYGSAMSKALFELVSVKEKYNADGKCLYSVYKLK